MITNRQGNDSIKGNCKNIVEIFQGTSEEEGNKIKDKSIKLNRIQLKAKPDRSVWKSGYEVPRESLLIDL